MEVDIVSRNLNFGYSKGNRYIGGFSPKIKEHAQIISVASNLPALKEFGKKYDYLKTFRFTDYKNVLSLPVYELRLTPVDDNENSMLAFWHDRKHHRKNKHKSAINKPKLPNLPTEICVWIGAYGPKDFIKNLKSLTLKELELSLKLALEQLNPNKENMPDIPAQQ